MRYFTTLSFSTCLLLLSLTSSAQQKNVLLIIVDDMNKDFGAYGGQAITPHLDSFALNAMRFDNAYCPSPVCSPSRTAMLTGYRPHVTGITGYVQKKTEIADNRDVHFRYKKGFENVVTLPQYFQQYCYETVAAGKIFRSPRGSEYEPAPGSDTLSWDRQWRGRIGAKGSSVCGEEKVVIFNNKRDTAISFIPLDVEVEGTGDWQLSDYCAKYLQQKHLRPFFLACGIYRPHLPWNVPKEYYQLYGTAQVQLPPRCEDDLDDVPFQEFSNRLHEKIDSLGHTKTALRAYLASMSYADSCIGHVLDALERGPHKDNTIVVIMGDHGWHFGQKNHWKKSSMWEAANASPLLIDVPGLEAGVCKSTVSLQDIYPTLLSLAGMKENKKAAGRDLSPLLSEPEIDWPGYAFTVFKKNRFALRTDDWALICNDSIGKGMELYDLAVDPLEWCNLAGNNACQATIDSLLEIMQTIADGEDYPFGYAKGYGKTALKKGEKPFKAFHNPLGNELIFDVERNIHPFELFLYDMSGRLIKKIETSICQPTPVDTKGLGSGLYVAVLNTPEGSFPEVLYKIE